MTIEEIAKALPTLDAGTLAMIRLNINTGRMYRAELEELRRNGASFKAIEDRLNGIIDGEFGRQNPDHNAECNAQWKLAILRQMKEDNHDA